MLVYQRVHIAHIKFHLHPFTISAKRFLGMWTTTHLGWYLVWIYFILGYIPVCKWLNTTAMDSYIYIHIYIYICINFYPPVIKRGNGQIPIMENDLLMEHFPLPCLVAGGYPRIWLLAMLLHFPLAWEHGISPIPARIQKDLWVTFLYVGLSWNR